MGAGDVISRLDVVTAPASVTDTKQLIMPSQLHTCYKREAQSAGDLIIGSLISTSRSRKASLPNVYQGTLGSAASERKFNIIET